MIDDSHQKGAGWTERTLDRRLDFISGRFLTGLFRPSSPKFADRAHVAPDLRSWLVCFTPSSVIRNLLNLNLT